jgi:hypothetical protein
MGERLIRHDVTSPVVSREHHNACSPLIRLTTRFRPLASIDWALTRVFDIAYGKSDARLHASFS